MPARTSSLSRSELARRMGGTRHCQVGPNDDGRLRANRALCPAPKSEDARQISGGQAFEAWSLLDSRHGFAPGRFAGSVGIPRDPSAHGFIQRDVIYLQRGAQRLVERDARVGVVGHGLHFRALAGGQIALVLNHLKDRGGAQRIASLVAGQGLFLKLRALLRPTS